MCVLSCFSCVWLCNPRSPGSSVHGILQARTLERAAMPFSRGSSQPRGRTRDSYTFCIGGQVLRHQCHLGSPGNNVQRAIKAAPDSLQSKEPRAINNHSSYIYCYRVPGSRLSMLDAVSHWILRTTSGESYYFCLHYTMRKVWLSNTEWLSQSHIAISPSFNKIRRLLGCGSHIHITDKSVQCFQAQKMSRTRPQHSPIFFIPWHM